MTLPWWLTAVGGAITASVMAFFIANWFIDGVKAEDAAKLAAQVTFDIQQCDKAKQITEDVSHDYQSQLQSLNDQLAAIKLRQPAHCIMPITNSTPGRNAASAKTIIAGRNGLSSDWLYDFAGKTEKYRIQLVSCQQFIIKEREK